jgi:hypothetical protein
LSRLDPGYTNLTPANIAAPAAIEAFIRSALVKIRTFEIPSEESLLVLS